MNTKQADFEIDLFKLIRFLWSKALVIILIALLVGSLVFAATYLFITPTYKALPRRVEADDLKLRARRLQRTGQYLCIYP